MSKTSEMIAFEEIIRRYVPLHDRENPSCDPAMIIYDSTVKRTYYVLEAAKDYRKIRVIYQKKYANELGVMWLELFDLSLDRFLYKVLRSKKTAAYENQYATISGLTYYLPKNDDLPF